MGEVPLYIRWRLASGDNARLLDGSGPSKNLEQTFTFEDIPHYGKHVKSSPSSGGGWLPGRRPRSEADLCGDLRLLPKVQRNVLW